MKAYLPLFVLSALVSCGPAPEIKKRAPLFTTKEKLIVLSERADKDVITTKYKDNIQLKCDFIIDNHPDTNVTKLSAAGFTVNLAKNQSPMNLVFKMNNGQVFTAGVSVKLFDILPERTLNHESGTIYVLKQTPVAEIVVRGRDVHGKKDKRYEQTRMLYENIPVAITNLYPKKYPHYMNCELKTEIPEKYLDQYMKISPEKEEAPVEASPELPLL